MVLQAILREQDRQAQQQEERFLQIMSAISEFAAKVNAFNDRQGAAVDGLVADVHGLKDLITQLQNSNGAITPEDQALLDAIEGRASAITDKLEALDAETPPVVPPPTT
jgi:hypothetical protein